MTILTIERADTIIPGSQYTGQNIYTVWSFNNGNREIKMFAHTCHTVVNIANTLIQYLRSNVLYHKG